MSTPFDVLETKELNTIILIQIEKKLKQTIKKYRFIFEFEIYQLINKTIMLFLDSEWTAE